MEDDYTGGDICIDGSTDCIGNDIVYGSRTDIHLKKKAPDTRSRAFYFGVVTPTLLSMVVSRKCHSIHG